MYLIQNFSKAHKEDAIILICVVRDEALLLPAFIDHYKNIGVSHFIFVDNGSEDDTLSCLLSTRGVAMQIWQTRDSYARNDYGLTWVNQLLKSECQGRWCVVVDADEFMMLNRRSLSEIRRDMQTLQQNVSQFVLVEFYPLYISNKSGSVSEVFHPINHSNHYDRFQNSDEYLVDTAPDGSYVLHGGMRQRVFWSKKETAETVCLSKKSFFYYTFDNTHRLSAGMHWLYPLDFEGWSYANWEEANQAISYHQTIYLIAHYKFVRPDLYGYFQKRIQRNQDWNNSEEYRVYLMNRQESFYDECVSRRYTTTEQLYRDTIELLQKSK